LHQIDELKRRMLISDLRLLVDEAQGQTTAKKLSREIFQGAAEIDASDYMRYPRFRVAVVECITT
jgi:hypothetical protein